MQSEAKILAARFGLRWQPVLQWMKANHINAITDLLRRYPGATHTEAMSRACAEIWEFHT